MLPPNSIIPLDDTHANVPAGWTRDTDFDDRTPKGATSDWGTTGGAATHTHTFSHTHTVASHTHTVTIGSRIDGGTENMGSSGGQVEATHSHFGTGTTGTSGSEVSGTTNATTDAGSSLPAYYTVIFIKSTGYSLIPTNGMIFRDSARTGLTYHSASENKFLFGATTGADAGGTGGASTHTHGQTHTHTANTHSHATGATAADVGRGEDGGSSPALAPGSHTHAFTVNAGTQNINSDSTTTGTANTDPLNTTLSAYIASSPSIVKVGDIVITTQSTNPVGWITCDGTNDTEDLTTYYVKNTQTPGTVAGVNTHDHTTTHSHTGSGTHTHSANTPTGYGSVTGGHNSSGRTGVTDHRHSVGATSSAVTANYNSTATTTTTDNGEPPYIKVRFIKATATAIFFGAPLIALL